MLRRLTLLRTSLVLASFALASFALGSFALGSAADQDDQARLDAALERVRTAPASVSPEVFLEIARVGGPASLETLEAALELFQRSAALRIGFGAFSAYKGTPQEGDALAYLNRVVHEAADVRRQRAATYALTYFPSAAKQRLLEVLRGHPDRECRSTALFPLLDGLVHSGDPRDLELILSALPRSEARRDTIARALARFDSSSSMQAMAEALEDAELAAPWKVILLDALEAHGSVQSRAAVRAAVGAPELAVRRRAIELVAARGGEEAAQLLREIIVEGRGANDAVRLLAELRDIDPTWVSELVSYVGSGSIHTQLAAIQGLGELPSQDSLRALHRLLRSGDWRLQLAVVRSLGKLRQRDSVRPLIEALGSSRGRVRADVHRQLRLFTGVDMGPGADRWKRWYTDEFVDFTLPSVEAAVALENQREASRTDRRTASFYGIEVVSDHVAFLIDVSGSMERPSEGLPANALHARAAGSASGVTTRLDVAKLELREALRQLLDGAVVNIIAFEAHTDALRSRAKPLDGALRKRALDFVERLDPGGGTDIRRALWRAFQDDQLDTVFLLSDGGVNDPELRRAFAELNRDRFLRVHGVSVGTSSALLRDLARDSGGQYVEVF